MEYRQVCHFLQASEDSSLSAAAEHLYISEQALSKSISKLEQELGVQLFTRHNKGITLTEFGNEFRAEALSYREHHNHILQYFQASRTPRTNTITVGIGAGLLDQWLSQELFVDFIRSHSDLEFNLINFAEEDYNTPSYMMYRFDLVLCSGYYPSENWRILAQKKRPIQVILSAAHPLAEKEVFTLRDLQHQYLAVASYNTPVQKLLIEALQDHSIVPNIRFSPSEIPLVNTLIHEAGLISFFGGDPAVLPRGIACREILDFKQTWDLYLLVQKERLLQPAVRELIQIIQNALVQ